MLCPIISAWNRFVTTNKKPQSTRLKSRSSTKRSSIPPSEKEPRLLLLFPDETIFKNYKFRHEYVIRMLKNYCYLNNGLTIIFNGEKYFSENGLKDLLEETISVEDIEYPIIHLKEGDIEIALTHSKTQYSEEYHSFVNGTEYHSGRNAFGRLSRSHRENHSGILQQTFRGFGCSKIYRYRNQHQGNGTGFRISNQNQIGFNRNWFRTGNAVRFVLLSMIL